MQRCLTVFAIVLGLLGTAGCSNLTVDEYAGNSPVLDPQTFFDGPLTAHGVIKDRSGKVIRYFAKYDDVFLWLQNVFYENNEIYLQFRLENKAHMPYDVNFLKFRIAANYSNSPNNIDKKH